MTPAKTERPAWYSWLPGWVPIVTAIVWAAYWVGGYTASVNARLLNLETEMREVLTYIHGQNKSSELIPDGISSDRPQVSDLPPTYQQR